MTHGQILLVMMIWPQHVNPVERPEPSTQGPIEALGRIGFDETVFSKSVLTQWHT